MKTHTDDADCSDDTDWIKMKSLTDDADCQMTQKLKRRFICTIFVAYGKGCNKKLAA